MRVRGTRRLSVGFPTATSGRGPAVSILLLVLVGALLMLGGCSSGPGVEWKVEETTTRTGENLLPLRNEILRDVKQDIQIWLSNPSAIEEAFTGNALRDWKAARALDRKESVKVIRVHKNQKFTVMDTADGIRPVVEYKFLDMTYYVDAKTGKPKTKPFNKQRTLSIYLVRQNGKFKIDDMIGSEEAIR